MLSPYLTVFLFILFLLTFFMVMWLYSYLKIRYASVLKLSTERRNMKKKKPKPKQKKYVLYARMFNPDGKYIGEDALEMGHDELRGCMADILTDVKNNNCTLMAHIGSKEAMERFNK